MAASTIIRADDIAAWLPRRGTVLVQGCASEATVLADAITAAGRDIGALDFTGIQVPGINRRSWLANGDCRFTTFFMTPELAMAGSAVTFLPFCYSDILAHWRTIPIAAAVLRVTPPDDRGICSFGPTVDFLAELWPRIPIRIAQVDPALPRTSGPTGIPYAMLDAVIEAESELPGNAEAAVDATIAAIANHVGRFIGDGATLQMGIGKLPGAILSGLRDRRRLRIHSGLIGDGVVDLLERGAIADGKDVVTGVAIGSRRLYAALPPSGIEFRPVSHTHDPQVLAALTDFVTVNSARSVDLFGQSYAETGPTGWATGTGGTTDFARGARAAGGVRILALPASARGASRIAAAGGDSGPVTLGRTDIDIVVTDHGAADLRGLSHDARAAAIVQIAAPEHREQLAKSWRDGPARY